MLSLEGNSYIETLMKDILVLCDSNDSNQSRVETAFAYAKLFNSHVTGVHMIPYPVIPVYGGMYPDMTSYSAAYQIDTFKQKAEELEQIFIKQGESANIPCDWKVIEGLNLDFVIENARYYDLVISSSGYSHYSDEVSHHLSDYFSTVIGRPLLILPNLNKVFSPPTKVIIAWNESHEAARAVHDAIPILRLAEHIQIVSVSKSDKNEKHNMIRAEQLRTHLSHHGIQTDVYAPDKSSQGIGYTIHECALEYNSDMIIMGAYGHSRFKEIILGGTTKHLIEHSTLPLLVSN